MRISTGQIWNNALSNLMQAQNRQNEANNQVSSQKIASDLGGYGRSSEVIAAYQSSLTRTNGYTEVAKSVSDRLDSQNVALERASDGIMTAKEGIQNAIATDSLDSLMTTLQSSYMAFADGINYKHQGSYLFSGGREDTLPLAANNLDELAATTSATAFANGTVKKTSKIDGTTTLQTGMLASDLGGEAADLFRQIKQFADANQPMTGKMTEAQQTFMQDMATKLGAAYDKMIDATALNGTFQNRVDNTMTSLESQASSLENLISDKTDVNMAEAYTRLEQAQLAVQASAQVVSNLRSTSLLDLLR
ncbi:flagellin [Asticcacaulis sp. BYS171W]|uniref:Flagellin n=1 Tax=Asticcacaulis aquaticus TaxID=2984212 RepID=A0ABT5HSX4_9CAUL|nr:flagellin [Asticcacaulis aquaticus]MDC7683173.1 flagellin [Asticcacaulis aquaticus]